MLIKKYKDFDDMYLNLNREFLLHPEMIDVILSDSGYVNNVVIGCKSCKCSLDLGKFGYKKNKWRHLLNTYIDYDHLCEFEEKLKTVSGLAYTFYFKHKKVNNGSCLICIVLTRTKRHGKWDSAKVFYRVTETQRRMAADLVMLNRFFTELDSEYCDIGNVVFYMAQCYCSAKFINGFYDYFKIPRNKLDYSHQWINQLKKDYEKYFTEGSTIHSFQTLARMQRLAFGQDKYESIDINELSIKDFFEKEKKK